HTIGHALIHIGDVVDPVYRDIIVDVRYLGDVHSCISNIYVLHVTRAGSIPGHEHFSWSQREPSNSAADSNPNTQATASDDRHQSGRINRHYFNRPRYPAPTALHKGPTAIVEGSEAPRFFFDPGPAPRRDINPMSVAVGRPVARNARRCPHISVSRNHMPAAVVI